MGFYTSTGGSRWSLKDNWGIGEPCVDRWHGVYCCPRGKSILVQDGLNEDTGRRSADLGAFKCRNATSPAETGDDVSLEVFRTTANLTIADGGCDSGTNTETAGCVVVMVDLSRNGLARSDDCFADSCLADALQQLLNIDELAHLDLSSNALGGTLDGLSGGTAALNYLDLSENAINGHVPVWFMLREWLRLGLSGNRFYYSVEDRGDNDIDPMVGHLVRHCKTDATTCEGVPPLSCDAFAPQGCSDCFYAVETMNPDHCLSCQKDPFLPVLLMSLAFFIALFGFGFYAWLIDKCASRSPRPARVLPDAAPTWPELGACC